MYHLSCDFNRKLFFYICICREGWQNLSNNNFCENRMTGSIVAFLSHGRCIKGLARDRLSRLLKLCFPVISLKVIHIFFRLGF